MKVLFTCGGTGGHINPALAIAKMLLERRPESEILFVGSSHGMESRLVPAEGFKLETIDIEGVSRKISPKAIANNVRVIYKVISSRAAAKKILRDFKPDVVVGTGGYACYPVLSCASKMKIPTIIHESNAYPGLVTRTLGARLSSVLINFDATKKHLKYSHNVK